MSENNSQGNSDETRIMDDLRKEKRISEENKVRVTTLPHVDNPLGRKDFHALTKDISLGGMRLITHIKLFVKTPLKIELTSSKTRKLIHIDAEVRWIKEVYEGELYEVGLQYRDTSPAKVLMLLDHIYGKKAK